jgi:hypothetical protein
MSGLPPRLGDLVDDYCPRCKLLLNHAIASMVEGQVAKVICQTCLTEHVYMHGKERKKPPARTTLFEQVLAGATPDEPEPLVPAPAKKRPAHVARYIARHKGKPPKKAR